ncbi:MAG: amidohydrolase family protein [Chloroflexi bacterium]|nr:amidohydrolase family protein [Chloroflexota bacterium]
MDYLKISADDHIDLGYLPHGTWLDRVPSALKGRVPHIEKHDNGEFWVCEGQIWSEYRSAEWFARAGRNPLALDRGGVGEEGRPVTTSKRLEDMDRDGVEFSVMFPPIVSLQVSDLALQDAIIQGYNDWAAEFAMSAPKRFTAVALLSPDNAQYATKELLRIAKEGRLKQVGFLVNDVSTDMYLEDWDPFWDAAEETGMIVSYHVGGSIQTDTVRAMQTSMQNKSGRVPEFGLGLGNAGSVWLKPFTGLFNLGVLERHPKLRFVLAESGTGWVPFVVQEMDFRYNRLFETRKDVSLKELPSDVFKRQVWATYQTDFVGLNLVDFFGEGHMMWASDYPHHDSTWPFSQEIVEKETGHLEPAVARAILRDNAASLYEVGTQA